MFVSIIFVSCSGNNLSKVSPLNPFELEKKDKLSIKLVFPTPLSP